MTPSPPGTWLISDATLARRKIAAVVQKESGALATMRKCSVAVRRAKLSAPAATWAAAMDSVGRAMRRDEQHDRGHRYLADDDGGGAEQDDLADRLGIEAPLRIVAGAQRAAAEWGKPERVADRQRDEGRQRGLGIGQGMLGVAQAEPVEERQRGIACRREGPRHGEPVVRDRRDGLQHPGQAIGPHLAPHQEYGSGEGEDDEQRQQAAPARGLHPLANIAGRGRFLCARPDITANLLARLAAPLDSLCEMRH
ncbi:MAG TPA: hypothetical protein VF930_14660, partial [Stellaceae bacterium]